jgi:hypothetical protein
MLRADPVKPVQKQGRGNPQCLRHQSDLFAHPHNPNLHPALLNQDPERLIAFVRFLNWNNATRIECISPFASLIRELMAYCR